MKKRIIKRLSVVYALTRVNIFRFLLLNKKGSTNIILVDDFFRDIYYGNVDILYNLSYINAFLKLKKDFKICNSKDVLVKTNKKIYLNLNKKYLNESSNENHSKRQVKFITQLEDNKNIVFPSSREADYWENKIFMYSKFEEYQINHPKTTKITNQQDLSKITNDHLFPVISKIDNGSGSTGIVQVKSDSELGLLSDFQYPYLIQNRLNITRDCRIVILNFQYNNHYFRNNTSINWHPTSTSMGSYLSYEELPEDIIEKVIEVTKTLNLRVAAYDICWDNDDFSSPIIFLEVSPAYLPNPKYYGTKKYKDWKTYFFSKNPYWKSNVDNIFSQKLDLLRDILIK